MKTVDVCLSPDLIHLYDVSDKVVVVVDILRATSCMTAGLANGVKSITPYENLEQCEAMFRVNSDDRRPCIRESMWSLHLDGENECNVNVSLEMGEEVIWLKSVWPMMVKCMQITPEIECVSKY